MREQKTRFDDLFEGAQVLFQTGFLVPVKVNLSASHGCKGMNPSFALPEVKEKVRKVDNDTPPKSPTKEQLYRLLAEKYEMFKQQKAKPKVIQQQLRRKVSKEARRGSFSY